MLEILKKAFLEGYATADIRIPTMCLCMISTALLSGYIYAVYKTINKNSFYNRNFNMSLITMAIITAAIILTVQSNIVVSLGMVGALSIVRFRTAIKDPMDLVFLFWSISVGIICGAGFAMIAVIASLTITMVIVLFSAAPASKETNVLVVNAVSHTAEPDVMEIVKAHCTYSKISARNVTKGSLNLAIEVKTSGTAQQQKLVDALISLEAVTSASLVSHSGDVTV